MFSISKKKKLYYSGFILQINYWNEKKRCLKEEQEEEKKEALFCVCVYLHFEIIWI